MLRYVPVSCIRMKRTFTTFILAVLASCSAYDQNVSIVNIDKPQEIILKNNNNKNTYALNIKVTGYIDGNAVMYLVLHDKPYKTKPLSGSVDFTWGGDWYSNDAVIVYTPTNVTKGRLLINYGFETL